MVAARWHILPKISRRHSAFRPADKPHGSKEARSLNCRYQSNKIRKCWEGVTVETRDTRKVATINSVHENTC